MLWPAPPGPSSRGRHPHRFCDAVRLVCLSAMGVCVPGLAFGEKQRVLLLWRSLFEAHFLGFSISPHVL